MSEVEPSSRGGGSVALLVVQAGAALVGGFILHEEGNQLNDCGGGCNGLLYDAVGAAFVWSAAVLLVASTTLVVVLWRKGDRPMWPPTVGILATVALAIIAGSWRTSPCLLRGKSPAAWRHGMQPAVQRALRLVPGALERNDRMSTTPDGSLLGSLRDRSRTQAPRHRGRPA